MAQPFRKVFGKDEEWTAVHFIYETIAVEFCWPEYCFLTKNQYQRRLGIVCK